MNKELYIKMINLSKEELIKWLIEEIEDNDIKYLEGIIKEVREYIENNWISQKDADIHRFDNEELEIEIGDIAFILEILDKVAKENNNEDN